jgi:hypothetical protein
MTGTAIAAAAVALALGLLGLGLLLRRRRRRPRLAQTVITDPNGGVSLDASTGAVRSVQSADLYLPAEALETIWSPVYLERLARTYWRFLSRVTLGLVHVSYTARERSIVLIAPPLKLLIFQLPEYELEATRGLVRWRIARGLLVSRRGRGGGGYLQIEVRRAPEQSAGKGKLHVEIEVANFYPSIASRLSRAVYDATQSRIHVIISHAFLRSLERLDLAESRVGRFGEPVEPAG